MRAAHQARQHRRVAHAGVEQAQRGGVGRISRSSSAPRSATFCFSLQVLTNARYFWRLS
jgi:hypothetical protein